MKKRIILLLVLAAAVMLAFASVYSSAYSVRADSGNFPEKAQAWLDRGTGRPAVRQVALREMMDIGSTRLMLVELDGGSELGPQLGTFRMEKGWNGQYRIISSRCGSGSLRDEPLQVGRQSYYVLCGRNALFGIREIAFTIEDESGRKKSYRAEIPEEEFFLTAVGLDDGAENRYCVPGSLRCYNAAGEDVTELAVG